MVTSEPTASRATTPAHGVPFASGFELGDVLRILTEQRRVILGASLLGLVLGIVLALLTTPLYRARAVLELNSPTNDVIDTARGSVASAQRISSQETIATQIGLLRSESLARRVAQDMNLVSDPAYGGTVGTRDQRTKRAAARILASAEIEPVKSSLLININYSSADPAQAAKIANAIAKGYIASSLERRYDSSSYARSFLSEQLARTKTALEESERKLNAYAIEAGLFRAPGQVVDGKTIDGATIAVIDLEALNSALNNARVRRINAETAWRNAGVDFVSDQASNTGGLIEQRATLQAQYEENSRLFKADYPVMRQIAAQIARLDAAINSERGRTSGNKRAELEGEYRAAQRAEAQLAEQVANAKRDVLSERGRSIEYNILQREADTNRVLYEALLQRYKEIGVAGGIGQSNVSLVDEAEPPASPFKPKMLVNALIGLLFGLAMGTGAAFAMHHLFDNIIDLNDVRRKLHLPVLGVVPAVDDSRSMMEVLADRKSDVSEAYYSVRTALTFSRPEGPPHSLLVTSTRPGEGKSTTSYAIARNMARLGKKVLLIDGDLRKPTFVSSREDSYGLAHLLGTEEPLANYVETTLEENLSLLPVGRFVGSAAELLSSMRLPVIIAEASAEFEIVVIDGPPVLGLTDAPLLSSVAQCTLFVIESRAARTVHVAEMVRRLAEAGGELIGVVLTKVSGSSLSYGYDYYSYNYGTGSVGGKVASDPDRALDLGAER